MPIFTDRIQALRYAVKQASDLGKVHVLTSHGKNNWIISEHYDGRSMGAVKVDKEAFTLYDQPSTRFILPCGRVTRLA